MIKMNYLHRFFLSLALSVIFLVSGCDTRDLHDLNINPSTINTIDLNYFFTAAELGSASNG